MTDELKPCPKPPRWYTLQEIEHCLERMNYSPFVISELAPWFFRHIHSAYEKGFEKGANSRAEPCGESVAWIDHTSYGVMLRTIGKCRALEDLPHGTKLYTHMRATADEDARDVTDQMVEIAADKHMQVRSLGMLRPWLSCTEETRAGYRLAMRAALNAALSKHKEDGRG
jgi:hypothetical protein